MGRRIQRFIGILEAGHRICLIIGGIYWLGISLRLPRSPPVSLSLSPSLLLSFSFLLSPLASYTVDFQLHTRGRLF